MGMNNYLEGMYRSADGTVRRLDDFVLPSRAANKGKHLSSETGPEISNDSKDAFFVQRILEFDKA